MTNLPPRRGRPRPATSRLQLLGVTTADVAEAFDVAPATVTGWVTGASSAPADFAAVLAQLLEDRGIPDAQDRASEVAASIPRIRLPLDSTHPVGILVAAGHSMTTTAQRMGVDRRALRRWLDGTTVPPADLAERLTAAVGEELAARTLGAMR